MLSIRRASSRLGAGHGILDKPSTGSAHDHEGECLDGFKLVEEGQESQSGVVHLKVGFVYRS